MGEIINLNRARKARAKADKEKTAGANRVLHGTPKALRRLEEAKREKELSRLESRKLDGED